MRGAALGGIVGLALASVVGYACATPTVINSVTVLNHAGMLTAQLAPRDTLFVDINMSDANNFLDITSVELTFFYGDLATNPGGPALRATYVWVQGTPQSYALQEPVPSTWQILPSLSTQTAFMNNNRPHTVRMAIVPGVIARASMGQWGVRVRVFQRADPTPSEATVGGLLMASAFSIDSVSTVAGFNPGVAGSTRLPLANPPDGAVHVGLVTNTPLRLQADGTDLVGVTDPSAHIVVGPPQYLLAWHAPSAPDTVGIETSMSDLFTDIAENVDESPQIRDVQMFLSVPQDATPQDYSGSMGLRLLSGDGGTVDTSVSLRATVVAGNLAAQAAVAEVLPHVVTAGTPQQAFNAFLLPTFGVGTSGIDRIRIPLPPGFTNPGVTGVRVGGAPVLFVSYPQADRVDVGLPSVSTSASVEIDFTASVPTAATAAAQFPVFYDDTTTSGPEQVATPGDADGIVNGDNWQVQVLPGPLGHVSVTPRTATLIVGDTERFTAGGTDDFGNPLSVTVSWSVQGGIGAIDSGGVFTATHAGSGIVVPSVGAIADTAVVTVAEPPVELTADAARQSATTLIPGAPPVDVFRFRITNRAASAETLVTVSLESSGSAMGTQSERDSCWSPLALGIANSDSSIAVEVAEANVADGGVVFDGLEVSVPADSSVWIVVRGGASLFARDGDALDLRVAQSADLQFRSGAAISGSFPLDPDGGFPIDGMSAAQIHVTPPRQTLLPIGTVHNVGLQIRVPANGYEGDVLRRMSIVNLGTASAGSDVTALDAWLDDGDATFDPARDTHLGAMVFTGDRWELTGIGRSVPPGGVTVFVTVDVALAATEGHTVRLGLASLPDPGLGMASTNTGPVDTAVVDPVEQAITAVDRIVLSASTIAPARALPGARDVPLLALVATNTYATPRHMTALVVTNNTASAGSLDQRDAEIARVRLRLDNGDGALDGATDSTLAQRAFIGGRAVFEGFDWLLPAESSRTLFVTADVAIAAACDGDSIAATVQGSSDVTFDTTTTTAAGWPLSSNARWGVDGMIADQVTLDPLPPVTYGPGDSLQPVLAVTVPRNGYADDVLHGISFVNLGTAAAGDIAELRLWRDDGDGAFQPTAALDLGPLTLFNGVWRSAYLSQPLGQGGARLFVTLTVGAAPRDSATVQLELPVMGVVTASDDHGPIDHAVQSGATQIISSAPLLSSITIDRVASTVGERFDVHMIVRNRGDETATGVQPSLGLDGASTGAAISVSGPNPATADIDPGGSATFTWTYQSTSHGEVRWTGNAVGTGAVSGLQRRSLIVASNHHEVYLQAASLAGFALQSMPAYVRRGEADVVPLSLTFSNDAPEGSSDVRLLGLHVRIESGSGGPIVPANVLSHITVREGASVYLSKTDLETSGSDVDLTLATPIRIVRGQAATIGLNLDVAPATTTAAFRVAVLDSTMIRADDAISGAPVHVRLQGQAFPFRSGVASVIAPATELAFDVPDTSAGRVNRGAHDVRLCDVRLVDPGIAGLSSAVRLSALTLGLVDTLGHTIADATTRLSRVRLIGPSSQVADVAVPVDSVFHVELSPPLDVSAGIAQVLHVRGDVAASADLGGFHVVVRDSGAIDARDANTGAAVPAYLGGSMVAGPVVHVELPATAIEARGVAQFPASLPVGSLGVTAFTATLRHPGEGQVASIRIDSLSIRVQDERRQPLLARSVLDRVHLLWDGIEIATLSDLPANSGVIPVALGLSIGPGTAGQLSVVADVQATAPPRFLEILIDAGGVLARDVNSGTAVAVLADSGANLPLTSGLTQLEPPATLLTVDLRDRLSAMVSGDGAEVVVGDLVFANGAVAGSSPIALRSATLRAADRGFNPMSIGRYASELRAYRRGVRWGTSGPLGADSIRATLRGGDTLDVGTASPDTLEIRMLARPGAAGSFRVGIDGAGVGVVQPPSALLSVSVLATAGRAFPMWTEPATLAPLDLTASYSNFPNPFAAGRGATTFVYYLRASARVSIHIMTSHGESVATPLDSAPRAGGLHQDDRWDGRNGRGLAVYNGIYVAELDVRYDDGKSERILRKLAVVR